MIQATIIFATFNGEQTLPPMLDALCASTTPMDRWKIVAVDNNSTDRTGEILASYAGRLPLEIYRETRPGKAMALDTGFAHLEGDLVIVTDDDIVPAPDWIEQYLKLAAEYPDYAIFGGLILPKWEVDPPEWIHSVPPDIVYALNGHMAEGPVPAGLIFGPNSAFRREFMRDRYSVQAKNIGPKADQKQYPMGGDTVFAQEIESRGHKAFNSKKPVVRHFIPKNYLDEGWILRRAERYGLGMVITQPEFLAARFKLGGYPVKLSLRFLLMSIAAPLVVTLPRSPRRFRFLWTYNRLKGILKGIRQWK